MTKRFGLIGKDISYSFSKDYFAKKFEKENLKNHLYVNFDIPVIQDFKQLTKQHTDLKGFNVTIPYKQQIIPYVDSLSKTAKKIGAINTIRIKKNGKLKGYNTDWYGFYHSIKPLLKLRHKKALILGNGGASKAIEYGLKKLNIPYKIVSRTPQKGMLSYQDITPELMQNYKIIINTTPLGTFPNLSDKPPIPYQGFTPEHIAYDLIYNPEQTEFLRLASQQGAQSINGYPMLVLQAEKAWKIWNK
ncbi:shikimate dehydrogenase family protein [Myroides sp. LJL119]